jgi:putative colanic acid biosynthesis acetyltransferase WcaF
MRPNEIADLSRFENSSYDPGPWIIRAIWFLVGLPLTRNSLLPFSAFRRVILRIFGAKIGRGVVIKPGFRVKYPWFLKVGNHSWLGEDVWIDNLSMVTIGNHVCISQGAYLCTGNHDWSHPSFRLFVRPIEVHDGAWVSARASLAPGTVVGEGAVVGFGAVARGNVPPYEIHAGNPARFVRRRTTRTAGLERKFLFANRRLG